MAWNEPGGNGGRDPWGGRPEQGPPDLDEVVRKLQRRLARLFGGKGGSGSGGGSVGGGGIGLIVLALVVLWIVSGIYIVNEGQRGVVLQFGAYKETTLPGPHWYPRFIQSVQMVDVDRIRSIVLGTRPDEAEMLTQDENIIDIKYAVQYKVKNARDYLFDVRNPDDTLRQAAESAVREVVGKSKMDFVLTGGRSEIAARAQALLQKILDKYKSGLMVTRLNMQDAQPPEPVQPAFADAVKAREDEQRLKNEAEAYANGVLPLARGEAARIMEEANGYKAATVAKAEGETSRFLQVLSVYKKAPAITRERLYLDTMQSVLSKSSKVVVDTRHNNNLLYLPLDKLLHGQSAASGGSGSSSGGSSAAAAGASGNSSGSQSSSGSGRSEGRGRDNLREREVR